jgi:hypothetical protein
LISADLNGDGMLDLLTYGGDPSPRGFDVYFGQPDGGLGSPVSYGAEGHTAYSLGVGDLNGDGHPDVVMAWAMGPAVDIYLNDGSGRFRLAGSLETAQIVFAIAVGDLNGDGFADLVLGEADPPAVYIAELAYGDGSGAFSTPVPLPVVSYPLVVGDLNQDGLADIAGGGTEDGGYDSPLAVLLNQGDGGFRVSFYPLSGAHLALLPNPGRAPDLVTNNGNEILVLRNHGDGTFSNEPIGASGPYFTIGDFNGDCVPDIATTNGGCMAGTWVSYGEADGGFAAEVSIQTVSAPAGIGTLGPVGSPRAFVTTNLISCLVDAGQSGIVVYGDASKH